jgi:hypothetical protein
MYTNKSRYQVAIDFLNLLRRLKVISEPTYWSFSVINWVETFTYKQIRETNE